MTTKFQDAVYKLTREIPRGKVATYKEIANTLGTAAYRAVGTALRNNPEIQKTPCHRVVNTNGELGGYAQGLEKKKALLKKEGIEIKNEVVDLKKIGHSFS